MPSLTADLQREYQDLWEFCAERPERADAIARATQRVLDGRERYEQVEQTSNVPWYVVGVIHLLEANCDFDRHLHNGDPLDARTVHVPANRPVTGDPPFTWEESAADALALEGLPSWTDWTASGLLYQLERYNGFGYRTHHPGVKSPYLWSYSTCYDKGKYGSDGHFDPELVSGQCGAAVVLSRLRSAGTIDVPLTFHASIAAVSDAVSRADDALLFQIDPGSGVGYGVELASDPAIFAADAADQRTDDTYHASWNDGGILAMSPYQVPQEAWERLRSADGLYYRAWLSSSVSDWTFVRVTTTDDALNQAPCVSITD